MQYNYLLWNPCFFRATLSSSICSTTVAPSQITTCPTCSTDARFPLLNPPGIQQVLPSSCRKTTPAAPSQLACTELSHATTPCYYCFSAKPTLHCSPQQPSHAAAAPRRLGFREPALIVDAVIQLHRPLL